MLTDIDVHDIAVRVVSAPPYAHRPWPVSCPTRRCGPRLTQAVVPANLQAVCCRLDHQPSLPAAAVGPCRDLTAAVGIPARRGGVMTGFVASQYIRPASVRRNYLR